MDPYGMSMYGDPSMYGGGRSNNTLLIVASCCFLMLVVLGGAAFYFFGMEKPPTTTAAVQQTATASAAGAYGSTTTQAPPATPGRSARAKAEDESIEANINNPYCQKISDDFRRYPGGDPIADPSLENQWKASNCKTVPSNWTCQDISNAYNLDKDSTYHPEGMHHLYKVRGCSTSPNVTCQTMSDRFNLFTQNVVDALEYNDNITEVEKEVYALGFKYSGREFSPCMTFPDKMYCQALSNFFNIGPKSEGTDPAALAEYRNKKCETERQSCESITNTYGDLIPEDDVRWKNDGSNAYVRKAYDDQNCAKLPVPPGFTMNMNQGATGTSLMHRTRLHDCLSYCNASDECEMVVQQAVDLKTKTQRCDAMADFRGAPFTRNGWKTYFKRRRG